MAETKTMTPDELSAYERRIQLGLETHLPDGRSIEDVRRDMRERHEQEREEQHQRERENFIEQSSAKSPDAILVSTTETGFLVSSPVSSSSVLEVSEDSEIPGVIEEASGLGEGQPETGTTSTVG